MLGSEAIMAFVATTDGAKARAFYEKLGLRFVSEDKFALQFDANGIVLRIQKMKELTPARFTVLGWEVADIERSVDALTRSGVQFQKYGLPGQDEKGIWASPATGTPSGSARVAWFLDPDGNVLSLTEFRKA